MFVGHYALGYILKKKYQEISLWLLFVAVQFVDILAFLFVLLGLERIVYNPSPNPFLRTGIEYVPYTHSLLGNGIIALVVLLLFWKLKGRTWGIVLAIGVFSHWFLDLIVHTPDLPLLFDGYKVGLGLWYLPWVTFLLELAFLILAGYYLFRGATRITRPVILTTLLIFGYATMFFAPESEITAHQAATFSLVVYSVFAILAYWSERADFQKGV